MSSILPARAARECQVGSSAVGHAQSGSGAAAIGLATILALGMVTFNFSSDATRDGVARRCDAAALATVGHSPLETNAERQRQWRHDRKLAFERCVDSSLLPRHTLIP